MSAADGLAALAAPIPGLRDAITDVAGLLLGGAHDEAARTGVSVMFAADAPLTAAVVALGGAPGTRETLALDPSGLLRGRIDGLFLAGGSVYGLAAGDAMALWLAARGRGVRLAAGVPPAPVVPGAILYDLANGGNKDWGAIPPYTALARAACEAASDAVPLRLSGAGFGARAGGGVGGLGTASLVLGGATVGALCALNAFGRPLARGDEARGGHPLAGSKWAARGEAQTATTLAIIGTDAALDAAALRRLAMMAQAGLARAVDLAHAPFDGDVVFAVSTGARPASEEVRGNEALWLTALGSVAAETLTRAARRAANLAD